MIRSLSHGAAALLLILVPSATVTPSPAAAGAPHRSNHQGLTFARFDPAIGDFSLWSARRDGSHQVRLSAKPSFFSDWSPDRRRIVYDFFDGPSEHIGLTDPSGRHQRQLTDEPGIQEAPEWSPDGRWIAYDKSDTTPDQSNFSTAIWIMRPNGSHAHRLTFDGFDIEPVFSPDGRQIAFGRITGINSEGVQQESIWVMNRDGSGLREVAPPELGSAHPDWSPDGRWIMFTTEPGGPESILRVHPDGSGLSTFRPATQRYQFYKAVWDVDGTALLVGCSDLRTGVDKICRMDAHGRNVRLVIDDSPIYTNYPSW